jgi:hypothetical protein
VGAIGALMALRHREVNGGAGQVVDVALYEAVFAMMESMVPEFDVFGFVRERTGNIMPGITPSNTHTTRDGKHVTIGANGDAIFRRFMLAIGRPDLADDPGWPITPGAMPGVTKSTLIDAWCAGHDEADILAILAAAEVPRRGVFGGRHVRRPAIHRPPDVRVGQAAGWQGFPHSRHRSQTVGNARRDGMAGRGARGPHRGCTGWPGLPAERIAAMKTAGAI